MIPESDTHAPGAAGGATGCRFALPRQRLSPADRAESAKALKCGRSSRRKPTSKFPD